MSAHSKTSISTQDDKGAFSLRACLTAWWVGYDILETPAQLASTAAPFAPGSAYEPAVGDEAGLSLSVKTGMSEKAPVQAPRPWALEDDEVGLLGAKLETRVTVDITKVFRALVINGWADDTESTKRGRVGMESALALVDEVEL
jgi:hypothetical protein